MESQLDRIERKLDLLLERTAPKPRKTRAIKEDAPEFADIWARYPKRAGSNSRQKAVAAFMARRQEGVSVAAMLAGTERYRAFCEASGKVNTEYVMQAQRFFGPGKEFDSPWSVPAKVITVPRDEQDLVRFAKERGLEARPGESMYDFRSRVENQVGADR